MTVSPDELSADVEDGVARFLFTKDHSLMLLAALLRGVRITPPVSEQPEVTEALGVLISFQLPADEFEDVVALGVYTGTPSPPPSVLSLVWLATSKSTDGMESP